MVNSPLPSSATEFVDYDVLPGSFYSYRMRLSGPSGTVAAEAGPVEPVEPDANSILVRPLVWVANVPTGGSDSISVLLHGTIRFRGGVAVSAGDGFELEQSNLTVTISPERVPLPGAFEVNVSAPENAPPARYTIPLSLDKDGTRETLWLFADVSAPLEEEQPEKVVYPFGSQRVGIHTDSRLRESEENIVIIKGELEQDPGDVAGTSVVARIDLGDGRVLEENGLLASGGFYSTSFVVPPLDTRMVVKVRVTWLGSSTSPGGVSPVLFLPVGGYSTQAVAKTTQTASPEVTLFLRGKTPAGTSREVVDGLIDKAAGTLLLPDFSDEDPAVSSRKSEFTTRLTDASLAQVCLTYLIGDCTEGSLELEDGDLLDPAGFAQSLPENAVKIVVVEGLQSECFQGQAYPEGTTVFTSSSMSDPRNRMDADGSYSGRFFDSVGIPSSVLLSHHAAKNTFLETAGLFPIYSQHPKMTPGTAKDWELVRRFVPAQLDDFVPPRILRVPASKTRQAGAPFNYSVAVTDNRDADSELSVVADTLSMSGCVLATSQLQWSATEKAFVGTVEHLPASGIFVSFSLADGSGNKGDPITLWIPVETTADCFDLDGSGELDENDLFLWSTSPCLHYPEWWCDFTNLWRGGAPPSPPFFNRW